MAVSIKSVERTDQGTINKIRLGNVQAIESLEAELDAIREALNLDI